ncbi:TPA: CsbD family protein [Streptococcus pneumoniae]|uniref:CsbD-like protein n=1 Tax=Streptococcus pneumoniae TaxID=1313 RepID=A0A4J2D019_STREE|nr:CsbD family protein [Streptococcus pneumoniae]VKM59775.1 CsbD-like protein [Streptococcus pneumoniae]VMT69575.1 CsbD-like protein [Streptococcus pneumoniae]VNQ47452.1 CsbD-like protein [Streptococcus pneumoniae]VRR46217.1 CsbD-like protein [Streptococcus pneumoniae]
MSLENKLEQATGAVKEGFGKVTGDSKTELEGAVEKTVAKAKDVVEDAKGAVEGLKNVFSILINNFLRRLYLLGRILSCPG